MSSTIYDVAQRAGVSISTVSRVLNGSSPVSAEKRALVLEAAEALGYAPNPAALGLHGKRTGGVGVLLPFVSGEFFAELLGGLDAAAQEHGLFLVISTSHRRRDEFQRAVRVLDRRVDGLIVMAPELDVDAAVSLARPGTPAVFLNGPADGLPADVLNFDNVGGVAAVTEHLVGLGHTRIAHVRGPRTAWDAGERERGFRRAMDAAGLPTDGLVVEGGYTREAGYEAVARVLAVDPRPTAIVAANDYCALGAISALRDAGVSVPGEVSVAGFDGLPSGQFAVPTLTTARVPVREIGAQALARLAARLSGDEGDAVHKVFPVDLVVRESTGAAPQEGS